MTKQKSFSRLMSCAGGHRYYTYASLVLSALSSLFALMPFWYIWRIIKAVIEASGDYSNLNNIARYGRMALMFAVISFIVYICGLMCSHLSAFRVASNLKKQMLDKVISWPLGEAERFGSGRLRRIINECSASTETYLAHQLPDMAVSIVTPLGLIALLFMFDYRLGLLSLVPEILGFLIMMRMAGPSMRKDMARYQNALEDMSNQAVEYVRGIPVVKTFGQSVYSFRRFKQSIDNYGVWTIAYTKQSRRSMLGYTVAINGVFAVLTAAALYFTKDGISDEFIINLMFYIVITPLISLTMTRIMYQSENKMVVDDAFNRIDTVLEIQPLSESQNPASPRGSSVELKNLSFSYDGKADAVHDVSLYIPSGGKAALVGPSGGGKSTIAALIARFFDPDKGSVLIGGVDVRDIKKAELMDYVSFVFQDSKLIKGTLADNVRLARPRASDDEVKKALSLAQCDDIIEKLPDGINTRLGTGGVFLSGGEQQRLAIARAFIKDSKVVILDEATAFADPDNENNVLKAFEKLAENRTVITIAHRLSSVSGADTVFVLRDGRIIQQGSPKELIQTEGAFKRMWTEYQTNLNRLKEKEATA